MSKIYIAAPFKTGIGPARAAAPEIEAMGHELTSTWYFPEASYYPLDDFRNNERIALQCLVEVDRADLVLSLTQPGNDGTGHLIEFGYALRAGKVLVVAGPLKSSFHHLAPHWFNEWGVEAKNWLSRFGR